MPYSADLIRAKEETEARTVTRDSGGDVDSPDYRSISYRNQKPDVDLMREVYGGTKTMREQDEKYLPMHPMEKKQKYKGRLAQAVAYNAVRRTVTGLAGMIFRRDPQLSDEMPDIVREHAENIDQRGNKLPVFLRHAAENALIDGHTWIHVESPPTEGFRNDREATEAGVRPYWINVKKSQAINWRYEMRGGRPVLTLFAYLEGRVEPQGEFGERMVQRIRVLREADNGVLGELWELTESDDETEWRLLEEYDVGVSEIPVVVLYAERSGEYESRPPLLDLAYEQIEHYRVRSDRQRSMTFSSIAVPYAFGNNVTDQEGNPRVRWSADGMLLINDPEASAGVIESHGYGLEATREELREIKQNMASLGLRMLVNSQASQPQTATSDILEKSESDASLSAFAIAIDDAANEALQLHADYESRIDEPGQIETNKDFAEQTMDPQMVLAVSDMVSKGQLRLETMWDLLIAGEILPESFDPELEREELVVNQPMQDLVALTEAGRRTREEEPPLAEVT